MATTSIDIASTIVSLDDTVLGLEEQAKRLALSAVEGDASSREELAETFAKIEAARRDRRILLNAGTAAREREANAVLVAEEAERARHMEAARDHVGELLSTAARVDSIIASLQAALVSISDCERAAWAELRAARAAPSGSVHGRIGLAVMAMEWSQATVMGKALFLSDQRSVAERAVSAWAFLATDCAKEG